MPSLETSQHSWAEMQALFHRVIAAPREDTEELLKSASDALVNRQVRAMVLAARAAPLGFKPGSNLPKAEPQRFRGYRVERLLGSGGSGSVYLVERQAGAQRQMAALKVFPRASTSDMIERSFAREEYVLASLAHPAIPLLLDAGLSDVGEPFLVMEYAQGERMDAFCNGRRLNIAERLRLMLLVCDALSYAHRSLVLHLDLKPANILASAQQPYVKLLDFGTARLVEGDRPVTVAHMATPSYASPEQMRGEALTTSADVYSLGAVLFELLSGRRPNAERSALGMAERSFLDAAPERLESNVSAEAAAACGLTVAQFRRSLAGELSLIVGKCMAPTAEQRYVSVDAVAADLRRYLEGRPVHARAASRLYRFGKFVKRNRTGVIAASVAIWLVLGSLGYATWRQHQALVAARRAVAMQSYMSKMFALAHNSAQGKADATLGDLLRLSAQNLNTYLSDPADQREARLSIAESMALDEDKQDAEPLFTKALADAKGRGDAAEVVRAEYGLGTLYMQVGDNKKGRALLSDAYSQLGRAKVTSDLRLSVVSWYVYARSETGGAGGSVADEDLLRAAIDHGVREGATADELASAWNILGITSDGNGALDKAQHAYDQALSYDRQIPNSVCAQGDVLKYLGHVKRERKDDQGALQDFEKSYSLERTCAGPESLPALSSLAWVSVSLTDLHRWQDAVDRMAPAMPAYRKVCAEKTAGLRLPLGALARAYLGLGRFAESEQSAREELASVEGKVPRRSSLQAVAEGEVAAALLAQGRFSEAAAMFHQCLTDYPQPATPTPSTKAFAERMQSRLAAAEARQVPDDLRAGAALRAK